jgi:hypothetical protein
MRMRLTVSLIALPTVLAAQAQPMAKPMSMTNGQFITVARGGAPPKLSANATVARINPATQRVDTLQVGTNGFTCTLLPDDGAPYCGDANAYQWFVDAFTGKPRPTNPAPGVSYMAKGGSHYETPDGQIVMTAAANTKTIQEPPHWMLLWAVDPATSGLPTKAIPGASGVYIMFAGTPYAHLMIYQDPATIVK